MAQKTASSDVLIVGTGVAGLYCALNLPLNRKITIIAKSDLEDCDSYLAQGGICMLRDDEDYDNYFEDTMHAGHYINDPESVEIMIRGSQDVIRDLIEFGVDFERNEDGSLKFTREGAHSAPRILFHQDITGKAITSVLLETVKRLPNVTILDHVTMTDIITTKAPGGAVVCQGIIAKAPKDTPVAKKYGKLETTDGQMLFPMTAREVVWACGGIGGLFDHSTNFPQLTGDALAIALRHGIELQDPDYIQIHPTTLFTEKPGRSFLISESVRGEGGILLNENGERFVNELLARDVVSKAILQEMKETGKKHVWLSMKNIPTDMITSHFKHIYERCLEEGFDCTKEPIPVVPAQHYFMGGVKVDHMSRTTMPQLFAAGETSCNGVHGGNRLASNSLLEGLVFAQRAALTIARELPNTMLLRNVENHVDLTLYQDACALTKEYKESVLAEIERMRKYHEQHHHEA